MKLTKADRDWANAVKERDGWLCRRCGSMPSRQGLHAHHIFTRGRGSTKYDLENGVALCYGDHRWAHANPHEFEALMRSQLGDETYEAIQQRSRKLKRTGVMSEQT